LCDRIFQNIVAINAPSIGKDKLINVSTDTIMIATNLTNIPLILGFIIFGAICDTHGRFKICSFCFGITGLFGIFNGISLDFMTFVLFRLVSSFFIGGGVIAILMILFE
jgi:MFS family permease